MTENARCASTTRRAASAQQWRVQCAWCRTQPTPCAAMGAGRQCSNTTRHGRMCAADATEDRCCHRRRHQRAPWSPVSAIAARRDTTETYRAAIRVRRSMHTSAALQTQQKLHRAAAGNVCIPLASTARSRARTARRTSRCTRPPPRQPAEHSAVATTCLAARSQASADSRTRGHARLSHLRCTQTPHQQHRASQQAHCATRSEGAARTSRGVAECARACHA
jgi:hypothetical protein